MSNRKYRIFASPDYDWFVAAHKDGGMRPSVLYQGDSQERAYEAILEHLDALPETEVREMTSGTYAPQKSDWATPKVVNKPCSLSYRHLCRVCQKPVNVIQRADRKGAEAIHVADLSKLKVNYALREVSISHWNRIKGKLENACYLNKRDGKPLEYDE